MNDAINIGHDVKISLDDNALIKFGLMQIIVIAVGALIVHVFRWIERR